MRSLPLPDAVRLRAGVATTLLGWSLLWCMPSTGLADTTLYSGNLETNANVTGCGGGCTLNPMSNTADDYAQWAAVVNSFTVTTASTLVATTYSYGGGTSLTGTMIPSGGFEPYLTLFDASGNFLDSTYLGTDCPAGANSVGGNCYDVQMNAGLLAPGTYQMAITDYANMSIAENYGPPYTLADGFTGLGALQPGENLNYAYDVTLTPLNSPPPVPEPDLALMAGLAAVGSAVLGRCRRR